MVTCNAMSIVLSKDQCSIHVSGEHQIFLMQPGMAQTKKVQVGVEADELMFNPSGGTILFPSSPSRPTATMTYVLYVAFGMYRSRAVLDLPELSDAFELSWLLYRIHSTHQSPNGKYLLKRVCLDSTGDFDKQSQNDASSSRRSIDSIWACQKLSTVVLSVDQFHVPPTSL
jgi:hypothetical protein